ncbi:MAG: hypothetical protein NVSMB13_21800 [Mycobacteriales bacterium]
MRAAAIEAGSKAVGRLAVLAILAVAVAAVHVPHRPTTICLVRALTGLPCPLCGSTTAAVLAGRGDLLGALRAGPPAVLAAVGLVLAPLGPGRAWWRADRRVRWLVIATALCLAEAWQLVRLVGRAS